MGKFDPFIPLAKQVGNKVKRRSPGLKVPAWYQPPSVTKPTGAYNPGNFQENDTSVARGHFNPGNFQSQDVQKPSGAYNPGGYKDPDPVIPDKDPWGSYYFSFELDDIEVAHFMECTGLKTSAEVFEVEEGGHLASTHKRTGRSKWDNIVLKRAVFKGHLFEEWRDYYMQPPTDGWTRRAETSAAIVMRANDGTELKRYTIRQPWPVSWEGPQLNSGGSDLAVESLEIAHEGLEFGRTPYVEPPEVEPPEEVEEQELEPVHFNFDETTYVDEKEMERNVEKINEDPDAKNYWVEGHTCDLGSFAYNKTLSKRRALTAANDLKNKSPQNNYFAEGYSYEYPVAPNTSEPSRARNRRGQIWEEARSGLRPGESKYDHSKPKAPR